ncbi:MAG: DUF3352 domain-containing protein [Pseudanabaenaceae cyanobacterium bins.68]|nr:DUF3352 domain-containing protein [Pseudanabaenaceae cyanobacterium bins.68]
MSQDSGSNNKYLLPAVGAALVAAGGAGAYFYFNQSTPVPLVATKLEIAKVIPPQALAIAHFGASPETLALLEQFQNPETKKIIQDGWQELQKELFRNTGLSYDQDVQPWSGEVAIAVLPNAVPKATAQTLFPVSTKVISGVTSGVTSPISQASPTQPRFDALVIFAVKDQAGANGFAAKVQTQAKTKAKGKTSQQKYKNITISQSNFGNGSTLNSAPIADYLVFASQVDTLKQAIDAFESGTSVQPQINPNQLQLKNPLFQLFVPDFAGSIERGIAASSQPNSVPRSTIDSLKRTKALNLGVGVDDLGLRLSGSVEYDPKLYDLEFKPSANQILSRFPQETLMLVTGNDLKNRWVAIAKELEKDPETKQGLAQIRQAAKSSPLALDLDKDLFGWMDGEFAIGLIASTKGILANAGAAPVLMIQTSDRAAADAMLKKVIDLASQSGVKFNPRQVNGVEVTDWVQGVALISHGWNQDTLFISAEPIADLIVGKPAQSIETAPLFKSLVTALGLPNPNLGYFYFDVAKSWQTFNQVAPAELKKGITPQAKAVTDTVEGLAASASMPSRYTNRFEMILSLKRAQTAP